MHDAEIASHELTGYTDAIRRVSRPCLVGTPCNQERASYFGGMPHVPPNFDWPTKDGHPLAFVGQIHSRDIDLVPSDDGDLLFFYDNRHWGYKPKDIGHAIVTHIPAGINRHQSDLPTRTVSGFFGLTKESVSPKRYERVNVRFETSTSYPWYERELLTFSDDVADERYTEFCCSIRPDIQIGGYPSPVQSDFMERDCINAFNIGDIDDWVLLLQLFEVGDMMWGDAGALYWFIHQDDLRTMRFDRVWMVSQCH
ncbi:MAG: YwqG family protein [Methyloligellaceae bacterium]